MSTKLLNRSDAPFEQQTWKAIDDTVVAAARSAMSVRGVLHTEPSYGLALRATAAAEQSVAAESDESVAVHAAAVRPVPLISATFDLPARDIAAFETQGLSFDGAPAARAARACAEKEDRLLLHGSKPLGLTGLLNTPGAGKSDLHPWRETGEAMEDMLLAVDKMDRSGYHGPYTLALSPSLYNKLFRRYPQGNTLELEHLRSLITGGITKIPAIASGGVLLAYGRQYASILIGQDLATGFEGPSGRSYTFVVSESVALWLKDPGSVCVLQETGGK